MHICLGAIVSVRSVLQIALDKYIRKKQANRKTKKQKAQVQNISFKNTRKF